MNMTEIMRDLVNLEVYHRKEIFNEDNVHIHPNIQKNLQ